MDNYAILPADGDPNGVRVQLPDGTVTSLHAHGGALDHLTEIQMDELFDSEQAFLADQEAEQ